MVKIQVVLTRVKTDCGSGIMLLKAHNAALDALESIWMPQYLSSKDPTSRVGDCFLFPQKIGSCRSCRKVRLLL